MVVNSFCVGQFVATLLYVNIYCKPTTKLHMALVGLSAVIGILLSGIIRRGYKDFRTYSNTKAVNKEVNAIVKKISENNP